MFTSRLIPVVTALVLPLTVAAQTRPASAGQKTIEISATEKVQVTAEIAVIKIGFQNQAATRDAAYAENTRTANKIVQALLEAGVPTDAIETESLSLEQERDRYGVKSEQAPQYSANQQWSIRSKSSEAQKIVDIAVGAGANHVENVEWSVPDPKQLEAKAYAAALTRAKDLAVQTASQVGLKLGDIISIVNSANVFDRFTRAAGGGGYAQVVAPPKMAMLKLHPGTVEREASVTVTYSVAQ